MVPSLTRALSHNAKGPLIILPSIISVFFPIYIGPFEALREHNGNFAPSSIKIFSGLNATVISGIGCDLRPLVIKLKSSSMASSFLEKISQVCLMHKISSLNSIAS